MLRIAVAAAPRPKTALSLFIIGLCLFGLNVSYASAETPVAVPGEPTGTPNFFCTFASSPTECGFTENGLLGRATIVNIGRDGATAVRLHTEVGDNWDVIAYGGSASVERDDLNLGQLLSNGYPQKEQWWKQSVLFPDDYNSPPDGKWLVISDFHAVGTSLATQANFQVEDLGPLKGLHIQGYGGVVTAAGDRPGPYGVFLGPVVKNSWYDFVYHVKWSSGSDGFFQVWVNGVQKLDYRGPTIYIQSGIEQGVYLKLANYHSAFGLPTSVIHDRVIRYDVATSPVAATYYVSSSSGNDANDGRSTATPWKTLAKAESTATAPGSIIALKRGDTWASTIAVRISHGGVSGKPIIWDGGSWGSGPNAVIQSSGARDAHNQSIVNIVGTSYVTFQNITVDGNNTRASGIMVGGSVDNYYSPGAVQNAESYIVIQYCEVKNMGDGTDQRVGIIVQTGHNDISNVKIQNNNVHDIDDQAITTYPGKTQDGSTPAAIRNGYIGYNKITNHGRRNASTSHALMINNKTVDYIIEHNTITTGASGHGGGIVVTVNEQNVGWFPDRLTIRYNDVRVTSSWALSFFQGQAQHANVYYNILTSGVTAADSSGGATYIWHDGQAWTGASLNFYNNVFYSTGGITFRDHSDIAGAVTIKNNIMYNTGADQYGMKSFHMDTTGTTVHSNNAMYRPVGSTMTVVYDNGYISRNGMAAWEPSGISADPLMTNPATFGFTLQSSSPAKDAGASLSLTPDFADATVPQGTAPDIGAFESAFTSSTPSFYGDWESGTITGYGNTNWRSTQLMSPDRFTVLSDGGARQGTRYARVEVRSGDNPLTTCCSGSERAEVAHMQNVNNIIIYENLNSGTQQYVFSVKFDPTWQTITDIAQTGAWGVFLQLHGPDILGTNPVWALSATDQIRFNTRGGDIMVNKGVTVAPNLTYPDGTSAGSLNIGKWIDFILTVKYAADNTGFVTLQRRDEGQTDFKQVLSITGTSTLQYDPSVDGGLPGGHYMKTGLYRNAQPFTSILYLDGFTRTAGTVPPPTGDTTAPSVPTALSGSVVSSSQINLSWTASTDNVGVAGYKVFRNGIQIATPSTTSYSDTGLTASTAYSYTVSAYDAAGNVSASSLSLSINTNPSPTQTFSIGARVKTTANLNVRAKPSMGKGIKVLCVQPTGSFGTIMGGPSTGGGYTWWNINYDTGCDGWSAQTYLALVTVATVPITRTLTVGATGAEVTALQSFLSTLGFFKDGVTGYFGRITESAVAQFQAANNLSAVGIVGPQTRALLQQLMGR